MQVRHPSALSKFEQIVAASKGKKIVMFLDYDGTLSPIVDDPDSAFMSDTVTTHASNTSTTPPSTIELTQSLSLLPQMRRAVRSVAKHFPTAIVSGRCRDKVHTLSPMPSQEIGGCSAMF